MDIDPGSRYASAVVAPVTGKDGLTRQTLMSNRRGARSFAVVDYAWNEGDRPDVIAGRAYGDETMWWVIAQANPEILDWTEVAPGRAVRIPSGAA